MAVPSALMGLTSLFEMERGEPHRNSHLKVVYQLGLLVDKCMIRNKKNKTKENVILDLRVISITRL